MTSYAEVVEAADTLAEQLQGFLEDERFVPRFSDRLFGLRTVLGATRDRFAATYGSADGDTGLFATAFDRCQQATAFGRALTSDNVAMAQYSTAVECAIGALDGSPRSIRPGLRGTLRLQASAPASVRQGPVSPAAPQAYYASLVKLFPVEAVALYPLAISIAAGKTAIRMILIGVITLFVIVLRWFGTQEESGGPADIAAIVISVISFLLSTASLGGFGYLPGGPEQTRQLLAFISIMWVALVPLALRRARR